MSTGSVRKLVAVGIERLSSMKRASVAAGPRIGTAVAPSGGAGACGAPLPCTAASTSSLVTRPRGPLPRTLDTSTPWALATRAATGVARPGGAAGAPAAGDVALGSAAGATGPGAAGAAPAPAAMRHRAVPTATVSSACTRISLSVPATGEGSSASTLSVEISTRMSSTATGSPDLLAPLQHRALGHRVAHLGEGDVHELVLAVAVRGRAVAGGRGGARGRRRAVRRGPRRPRSRRAAAPTWTVSSGPTRMRTSVPEAGDGTSASTLSVDTSTSGSSAVTASPTCFSQSSTVPSVTDSPIAGIVIWTVVACVAIPALQLYPRRFGAVRAGLGARCPGGSWQSCAHGHRNGPKAEALGLGLRGPAARPRGGGGGRARRPRAPRIRRRRGGAAGAARPGGAARRRGSNRPPRSARSAVRTATSAPRTRTGSPTATWCAPSAGASTTRRTWWRIRATRASSRRCWPGAPRWAPRRSRSAAAPAWWAAWSPRCRTATPAPSRST